MGIGGKPWGPQQAPIGKKCDKCSKPACADTAGPTYLCQDHVNTIQDQVLYTWEQVGQKTWKVLRPAIGGSTSIEWRVEVSPPYETWYQIRNGDLITKEVVEYGLPFGPFIVMKASKTYDAGGNLIRKSEATIEGDNVAVSHGLSGSNTAPPIPSDKMLSEPTPPQELKATGSRGIGPSTVVLACLAVVAVACMIYLMIAQSKGQEENHSVVQYESKLPDSVGSEQSSPVVQADVSPIQTELDTLLNDAKQALDAKQWQKAIRLYESALRKSRAMSDKKRELLALLGTGRAYESSHHRKEALKYFLQALPMVRRFPDTQEAESQILVHIIELYTQNRKPKEALRYYEQLVALGGKPDNPLSESDLLFNIGMAFYEAKQNQKALEMLNTSLSLSKQVDRDPRREADRNALFGLVYTQMNQPQNALGYLEEAASAYNEVGDRENEALIRKGIENCMEKINQ